MNPSSSSTSYWNNPPPPGTEFDVPEDASPLTSLKIECRSNHKSEKQTESSVKYPGTEGERPIERTRYKSRSHSPHHHKRRKRSRSRSKDRHRHSRPHRRRRRYSSSRSRSRSRSPSHRRKRRTKRYSRSRSKSRSRSYSISRSYKSDRDKKYSHSSRVKNDRATQKKKQDDLIKPAIIKEEIEEEEEDDDDEEQTTPIPFKNDGSFLEMFKKMQEEKIKEEAPDTEAQKKPILPAFGKRRGGKVLKTGLVQKVRNIEEDDSSKGQDAWSVYMNEVKKYKEACCNEDSKTRPLLK